MAEYKRFLSYLYEYDGDEKKENCGFARVEIRGMTHRIFLSVKSREQVELLHVFGFYREGRRCICVPLGRMMVKGGRGQLQYQSSGPYLTGSSVEFDRLAGMVAGRQNLSGNAYATVWDDEEFALSMTGSEEAQQDKTDEDNLVIQAEEIITENGEQAAAARESEVQQDENKEEESEPQISISSEEKIWNSLSGSFQHIETLPGDRVVCLKAAPADIGRLPRSNWVLSSNGFLMYSYVKYRYIVFARLKEDCYELWLPGNYEKNEEVMASMFGFRSFRSAKSRKAVNGDFGYWCIPLDLHREVQQNSR